MNGTTPEKKIRPRTETAPSRRSQYLTPQQVADRLLVAPVTVRLWANRGLLPFETTLGGHRRFREEDVELFVSRRRLVPESEAATPARMLVIDDDAKFARYLTDLLAVHAPGLSVDMASDGFLAGIKCEALRPDIVTVDPRMRQLDGFEVCRTLRDKFGADKPRIVVLTDFLSEEDAERIGSLGANGWVIKTAPLEKLLQAFGIAVEPPRGVILSELSLSSQSL